MDKIQQLKTWLEDTIKHGGNNQHTLSGVLQKIDEIYEWDKCVLAKAREIEAEQPVWTPFKGEEIDVSDDGGKTWDKRTFMKMVGDNFRCYVPGIIDPLCGVEWNHARPSTVEKETTLGDMRFHFRAGKCVKCVDLSALGKAEETESGWILGGFQYDNGKVLPEEIKRIELPPKYESYWMTEALGERRDTQVEALTKSLREVIEAVNKLNK